MLRAHTLNYSALGGRDHFRCSIVGVSPTKLPLTSHNELWVGGSPLVMSLRCAGIVHRFRSYPPATELTNRHPSVRHCIHRGSNRNKLDLRVPLILNPSQWGSRNHFVTVRSYGTRDKVAFTYRIGANTRRFGDTHTYYTTVEAPT